MHKDVRNREDEEMRKSKENQSGRETRMNEEAVTRKGK